MPRLERLARRVVPSTVLLSRSRLMRPVDVVDRALGAPFPEFRGLPPNRYRIRIGTGSRLLFNQARFRQAGYSIWLNLFAQGLATNQSRIIDVGCGCGRMALPLTGMVSFTGHYAGTDIDPELIAWCQANIQDDRVSFEHADLYNALYNPGGKQVAPRLPSMDGETDTVVSFSLFTHLLEEQVMEYLREARRVLRPDGSMVMSVFCLDRLRERGALGGRWTFEHRSGRAYVEDQDHPEAAVAYTAADLRAMAADAGLDGHVLEMTDQSWFVARPA